MLPEVTQFEDTVTLVSDTGIQFMDFALRLDPRKEPAGEFAPMISGLICRLAYNEEKDFFFYEPEPEKVEKSQTCVQRRHEKQPRSARRYLAADPVFPLYAAPSLR